MRKTNYSSGAEIGDDLYLTNLTGWSGAGLALLKAGKTTGELEEFAIAEHKSPSVDYENGIKFSNIAKSLCDVSDSVLIQGEQLAERSGVALEIDGDLISQHMDFKDLEYLAKETNQSVWQLVLGSGEDHAFLGTGKNMPFFKIGTVVAGSGIKLKKIPAIENGWEHFKIN